MTTERTVYRFVKTFTNRARTVQFSVVAIPAGYAVLRRVAERYGDVEQLQAFYDADYPRTEQALGAASAYAYAQAKEAK